MTHEGPALSWVQSFLRTCDGRSAYFAMKQHYLGESFTARLRANADRLMDSTFYDGRSHGFTFERYCETLQQAFTVRILMLGIRDDRLATAKSQVTATPELKATFDGAVNFISQFLDERRALQNQAMGPPRNVSVTNVRGGGRHNDNGRGRGGGRGNGRGGFGRNNGRGGYGCNNGRGRGGGRSNGNTVLDRYYSQEEWSS